MPTTVGSYSVASFTSPSNGDALDATVVKGNDNTLRTAYVSHDAEPGIHVQSSLLASRPAAGTAGRKWMTTDAGSIKLWYDNGSTWEELGATAAAGTLTGTTLASNVVTSSLTTVGTLGSLTVSGTSTLAAVNMADNTLTRPVIKDYGETRTTPSISSGTLTLNLENGNVFGVSLNANITTLTIQNPPASGTAGSFTLAFTADGTLRTITWGGSVKWSGGVAPTMTSTNGKVDIFTFVTWDAGTNWYAFVAGQNF